MPHNAQLNDFGLLSSETSRSLFTSTLSSSSFELGCSSNMADVAQSAAATSVSPAGMTPMQQRLFELRLKLVCWRFYRRLVGTRLTIITRISVVNLIKKK